MRLSSLLVLALSIGGLLIFPGQLSPLHAQEDGLFATFQTSLGNFRARLASSQTPTTVSNFVGLVEGQQPALHFEKGRLITSGYYENSPVHRVAEGQWIEAGMPAQAEGQTGPGYTMPYEFHQDLHFNEPYRLAMVNDGSRSSGSRFVITVAPALEFYEIRSVFGEVIEGESVVEAIAAVETDSDGRPIVPLAIESVSIEREGALGKAFVPDLAALPQVGFARVRWAFHSNPRSLNLPFQLGSEYWLLTSPDLQSWSSHSVGFFEETVPAKPVYDLPSAVTEGQRAGFFKIAEIRYPLVVLPPPSLVGKSLKMELTFFGDLATRSSLE